MMNETEGDVDACFVCGNRAGFNRSIVDLATNAHIGRLCVNCERAEFGRSLQRVRTDRHDNCLYCERDAQFALPRFLSFVVEADHASIAKVSSELDDQPVTLCDEHLYAITGCRDSGTAQTFLSANSS
ncbi:MAG: hypothetical protein ACQETB_09220 [Halobacteriota archaeon]